MPNNFYSGRFLEEQTFCQNWLYVAVFIGVFIIIVVQNQLPISFGTALVCDKILRVKNPSYKV